MNTLVLHKDIAINVELVRDFLAKCVDLTKAKDVRDKLVGIASYRKAHDYSIEAQNEATELVIRTERRLGELLRAVDKPLGGRPPKRPKTSDNMSPVYSPPTLADMGFAGQKGKKQAERFQKLAEIPLSAFERHLETTKGKAGRVTKNGTLDLARQDRKEAVAEGLRTKPLPTVDGRFDVIVIDPPWQYEKRADDTTHKVANPYPDMDLAAIKRLPVVDRSERHCVLWLWTTNAFIRDAFECLDSWGFEHKTILTWAKNRMGTGDWLRGKTEHCLMAVRGKPTVVLTTQTTLLLADVREHSRKPDEFYSLVESLCPGSKLEFFSRSPRAGWISWGAETNKFSAGRRTQDSPAA